MTEFNLSFKTKKFNIEIHDDADDENNVIIDYMKENDNEIYQMIIQSFATVIDICRYYFKFDANQIDELIDTLNDNIEY